MSGGSVSVTVEWGAAGWGEGGPEDVLEWGRASLLGDWAEVVGVTWRRAEL